MTDFLTENFLFQICLCEEEYLFLGSRLGNSLLLRFKEKDENMVITIDDDETVETNYQQSKRLRLEEEELEVYGSGAKTSVHVSSYIFEVCDSLLNIGPIGYMAVGEKAQISENSDDETEEKNDNEKIELEIVTSSGYGKNGALCVLHNSIRPNVITSFELPGCLDLWTVIDDSQSMREDKHTFIVLSQRSSTMVLRTAEEITGIHNTGFSSGLPTIFVGNVGSNRFIIQVTTKSIRLLQGTRLVQSIPIDLGSALTTVSVADPYVCVRAGNGQVITLALRETKENPRLAVNKNTIVSQPKVVGMSIYKDVSGCFTTKLEDFPENMKGGLSGRGFGAMKQEPDLKIEDEEDLLYGESGSAFKMTTVRIYIET